MLPGLLELRFWETRSRRILGVQTSRVVGSITARRGPERAGHGGPAGVQCGWVGDLEPQGPALAQGWVCVLGPGRLNIIQLQAKRGGQLAGTRAVIYRTDLVTVYT